jgi:hypothetical protein
MIPALVMMTILGCDDAATQCHFVAQPEQSWESVAACHADAEARIRAYGDVSYPVVVAFCEEQTQQTASVENAEQVAPAVPVAEPAPQAEASPGLAVKALAQIRAVLPERDTVTSLIQLPADYLGHGYSWVMRRF